MGGGGGGGGIKKFLKGGLFEKREGINTLCQLCSS